MANATELVASRYSDVPARGESQAWPAVRRELDRIIAAGPTQLDPLERGRYLEAILSDLEPGGAVWPAWPEDLRLLALTAVKVLGRNPVGSKEVLLKASSLRTVVFHTALSVPLGTETPGVNASGAEPSQAAPVTPAALEATRALANILVLHAPSRKQLADMGVGQAVARALAKDATPDYLFLLGRVAFLVTADGSAVRSMVEDEDLVLSLVKHVKSLKPESANYDALGELLKLAGNVVRTSSEATWSARLNPLLRPILDIVYAIDQNTLAAPLSHALNALIYFPFSPELLPSWHSVAPAEAPEESGRPGQPSRTDFVRATSTRLTGMFRRKSKDQPTPQGSTINSGSGAAPPAGSDTSSVADDQATDPTAFPARLLGILTHFVDTNLKGSSEPSADLPLDEILPPPLLLASHAASGSPEMRAYMRKHLFPPDLDRGAEAGPLEKRPGLLGTLLRLLNGTAHPTCRDTAGELLWNVCDSDPNDLCEEIGYGNAAGLLFRKGLSGPPEARAKEIPEEDPAASSSTNPQPTSASPPTPSQPKAKGKLRSLLNKEKERNPITALETQEDTTSPFAGMSEEDKEAEAEKMFVLFDRLSRNPVLSAGAPQADGRVQNIEDAMREQVAKGRGEDFDLAEEERERKRLEIEEEKDEEEALREIKAYRERMGRK